MCVLEVLEELAARPGIAPVAARLAWVLGRGLGQHLLQLQLWALQVGRVSSCDFKFWPCVLGLLAQTSCCQKV